MIHTIYHHGDEVPATGLGAAQIGAALNDPAGVLWVDLEAPDPAAARRLLAETFGFHPLTVDDCLDEEQRPKLEDFGSYVFVVARVPRRSAAQAEALEATEVDLYLGPNYVVTVHAAPARVLTALRDAVARDSRLLARGADRLAAECLDALAREALEVLDRIDDELEGAEDDIFGRPTTQTVNRLFHLRHELASVRRLMAPQREVLNRLAWDSFEPVRPEARLYFREVFDQLVQILDLTDTRRDLAAAALETYLSVVSNRLNETMKLMTAVQMVFLPLTLVASIYGMNFPNMPPYALAYGWQVVWALLGAIGLAQLVIFRRLRWL